LDPSDKFLLFLQPKRAQVGLAQPQACRAGDVSAALCLQVAAGELAAATRLRLLQAFEHMHALLCHRVKAEIHDGIVFRMFSIRSCLTLAYWIYVQDDFQRSYGRFESHPKVVRMFGKLDSTGLAKFADVQSADVLLHLINALMDTFRGFKLAQKRTRSRASQFEVSEATVIETALLELAQSRGASSIAELGFKPIVRPEFVLDIIRAMMEGDQTLASRGRNLVERYDKLSIAAHLPRCT
jgi:hypothetical protein